MDQEEFWEILVDYLAVGGHTPQLDPSPACAHQWAHHRQMTWVQSVSHRKLWSAHLVIFLLCFVFRWDWLSVCLVYWKLVNYEFAKVDVLVFYINLFFHKSTKLIVLFGGCTMLSSCFEEKYSWWNKNLCKTFMPGCSLFQINMC